MTLQDYIQALQILWPVLFWFIGLPTMLVALAAILYQR